MYYLTNNKIEYEGHIFTQIQRYTSSGKLELGGYIENGAKISGNVWIGPNSYVFKDCILNGNIRLTKNCVIKNSKLYNNMIFEDGCLVENSNIEGHIQYATWFEAGCDIKNQSFKSVGKYPPFYFQDGKIYTDVYNNVILTMTDNYCRVDCLIMTYENAWEYLHNQEKWDFIKSKHPTVPEVYYNDTKRWLYYWCERQLKRKEGRAK